MIVAIGWYNGKNEKEKRTAQCHTLKLLEKNAQLWCEVVKISTINDAKILVRVNIWHTEITLYAKGIKKKWEAYLYFEHEEWKTDYIDINSPLYKLLGLCYLQEFQDSKTYICASLRREKYIQEGKRNVDTILD